MSININFLLHSDEEEIRRKKRAKTLNFIAFTFLISICLISVGIFILIQSVDFESIRNERRDVLEKISKFKDRQDKLAVANDRIENIDKILKTRRDFPKITNDLLVKVPSNLTVDNFEVDNESVVISGQSKSLFAIGEFLNSLTDMVRKKEIIKSLTLNSLVLNYGNSVYGFSVKSQL